MYLAGTSNCTGVKSQKFNDKVCWITGASSGIGASLAQELSLTGAKLILSARNVEGLEKVRSACLHPEKVTILAFDMEDEESLPEFTMKAWDVFKGIDYVFLNAGLAVRDWVLDLEIRMFKKVMAVNFFSAVIITKTLLPFMIEKKHGHFVITSSQSGKHGIPKLSAYSSSKHALHGFFETLRAEYFKDGIRVTMIVPGLVRTDITIHSLRGDGSTSGKMQAAVAGGISPVTCARKMIKVVAEEKNESYIGGMEIYSIWLKRFFPALLDSVIRNHPMKKVRQFQFHRKIK